jgi:proteic killer suppression protein
MILSFRDAGTQLLWETGRSRRIPSSIRTSAWKKLAILNAAVELDNLKVPPGNRLEALKKDRKGQHSIRINDQYRICFVWRDNNAHDVEIVDYY